MTCKEECKRRSTVLLPNGRYNMVGSVRAGTVELMSYLYFFFSILFLFHLPSPLCTLLCSLSPIFLLFHRFLHFLLSFYLFPLWCHFSIFCIVLWRSTLTCPLPALTAARRTRVIWRIPHPPFPSCPQWSVSESAPSMDHTRTPCEHLVLHAWASFMHQKEAVLLPAPPNPAFLFISLFLLAGCCLSVAACGTLGAAHSWSFVLCGVFIMGDDSPSGPHAICLRDLSFPNCALLPYFHLLSFSILRHLTGAALLQYQ